jgi:hypothetical protein
MKLFALAYWKHAALLFLSGVLRLVLHVTQTLAVDFELRIGKWLIRQLKRPFQKGTKDERR